MTQDELYKVINAAEGRTDTRSKELNLAFPALMRKVYTWMALALAITGITAYGVATSPALLTAIFTNKLLFYGLIIAELGIVFYTTARLAKLSLSTATLLFILFSVINGATLASVFVIYTMSSIATTFFVTAGTFGAMAFIGYTTKRDLTKMGGILMMALIGLIIAAVVNMFLHNSTFDLIVSGLGVLIFTGLTAWDSQAIKRMLLEQHDMSEGAQKVALLGSLSLYLDFINMFLYLLRFLGDRK